MNPIVHLSWKLVICVHEIGCLRIQGEMLSQVNEPISGTFRETCEMRDESMC